MIGKRFEPVKGQVYTNTGGGAFLCLGGIHETPYTVEQSFSAFMINVMSGWTFMASGLIQYEDGTIEWDYSSGGHFGEVTVA